jgi:tetratricopeptide (TPR) repeat protein
MPGLGDDDDFKFDIIEESSKLHVSPSISPSMASQNPIKVTQTATRRSRPSTFMKTIFGECLCEHFPRDNNFAKFNCNDATAAAAAGSLLSNHFSSQYIELHGIQFIGLGALEDELTAKERVYDTLEQLSSRTDRLISIGYISVEPSYPLLTSTSESESRLSSLQSLSSPSTKVVTTNLPLDVWKKNYPNDRTTSKVVKRTINNIKSKNYPAAIIDLQQSYKEQKRKYDFMKKNIMTKNTNTHTSNSNSNSNSNNKIKKDCYELYMLGITVHNIGVVHVLDGHYDKAMPHFEEAVVVKSETLGPGHPEVAISLDELGIQLFALERYDEALITFRKSQTILSNFYGPGHPQLSMVLNNIACCIFQMRNIQEALATMKYAMELQKTTTPTTTKHFNTTSNDASAEKTDLDLLHTAIILNNIGYLKVNVKEYDEARSNFEDALLIQQSVLGDAHNHRAIRDSRKNLEFTNAFHSD